MLGIMGEKNEKNGIFLKKITLITMSIFFETPQKVGEKRC